MHNNLDGDLKKSLIEVIGISDEEANDITKKINDDLEKIRLLCIVSFLKYVKEVNEPGNTFKLLGSLFVLESLVAIKQKNKLTKVQKLLGENLSNGDKIYLLSKFHFSKEFEFKMSIPLRRHIMFEDFDKDVNFKKDNFWINEVVSCHSCYCVQWLRENLDRIDRYLDTLVKYLYEIRHAIVHESSPISGLPRDTGGLFYDYYPVGKDLKHFRAYCAYITPVYFFNIITNCIKNYLLKL